jgi:hypothetical protein
MIEPNNPDLDVEALMGRVYAEVVRRQFGGAPHANGEVAPGAPIDTQALDGHTASAARLAEVRTKWTGKLTFFPFNLPAVRRVLLRVLAFVFRDQRNVNFELIYALRECSVLNARLRERIGALEERIARLELRE